MSEAEPNQAEWWIVVLETVSIGDGKRWGVGYEARYEGEFADIAAAAEALAWEHRPQHPMRPQDRRVYRVDDRTWLVVVEGRIAIEPFEVRVVQRAPAPVAADGSAAVG